MGSLPGVGSLIYVEPPHPGAGICARSVQFQYTTGQVARDSRRRFANAHCGLCTSLIFGGDLVEPGSGCDQRSGSRL